MLEQHRHEQYFYDKATIRRLADALEEIALPCCLCTPLVGAELERRGVEVRTLDRDTRFSHLKGFQEFDLHRPRWMGERYGAILCDPPFFNVSLSRLFTAIRLLSQYDLNQPLLVDYLTRRGTNLVGTFAPFGLEAMGFHPTYQTVQPLDRNDVEFYGNCELLRRR